MTDSCKVRSLLKLPHLQISYLGDCSIHGTGCIAAWWCVFYSRDFAVCRAKEIATGKILALKKIKMEREKEGFPLTSIREINILLALHHENIVNVTEVSTASATPCINTAALQAAWHGVCAAHVSLIMHISLLQMYNIHVQP